MKTRVLTGMTYLFCTRIDPIFTDVLAIFCC